ncbi:MAG: hypothetical protein HY748_12005 [Elusimicrobia bacterium]|nr:hypothetical protein [Elusimicrobiota bacterium]
MRIRSAKEYDTLRNKPESEPNRRTLPKIHLTENQAKVIGDKYLRDSASAEAWLDGVVHNVTLAEILYHPDAEKWGVFSGVHHVVQPGASSGPKAGRTFLFHDGLLESGQRDANFAKLVKNLENVYATHPEARRLVDAWWGRCFESISRWDFLPNSPTLMNSGRELQQLSACYVLPVPDSMEGITKSLAAQSLIQKSGGGTGFSFSRLRPKGDIVKKTQGVASGAISFMQIFDKMTDVVKQGGTRRGANMGILHYTHPEIREFIVMKAQSSTMENFNISVSIDEKFMKAVLADAEYELVNPRTKEVAGKARAKEVFDMMVEYAWKSGDPGFIVLDRINNSGSNPTPALGPIESTNPCFAGHVRLATDKGLLTFEELYLDKRDIAVATDDRALPRGSAASARRWEAADRVPGACAPGAGAVAVAASHGVTMRKAAPVFKTRKGWPVFRLETEHGFEVTATADHKFFTPQGIKELKDLRPGDEILVQSGRGAWSRDAALPPFIPENKLRAREGRGEARLPKTWSRDLGELIGWVVGDGWVSEEKPKGRNIPNYAVGLMYGDEEKKLLAPKFKTLIKGWTGLEGSEIERNGSLTQYYKSALYYFLDSLGVHEKNGLEKQVPESLWKAPREAVLGFLAALFTADGTVNVSEGIHYGSIRLANSSKKLLQEVQLLLINEGIVSQLYLRRKAGTKLMPDSKRQPRPYPFKEQYELVITRTNRARFLEEIGFLTPSKQRKALAFESALSRGAYRESFTTRVKTVTAAGHADVYCTTEPETHSLISAGIISRNCGEQPLLPWEPCNLGSINLSNFVDGPCARGAGRGEGTINYKRLGETVRLAVRFLDDVIDVNNYPLPEIEKMAKGNRRIGLGVMGFAEALVKLGLPYDSAASLETATKVMRFINDSALAASEALARERGVFPNWKNSVYDPAGVYYRGETRTPRHCARTTIAPTGTIAIAAGLQGSGIEPFFAIAYTRYNAKALDAIKKGETPKAADVFFEVNPLFREVAQTNNFFGLSETGLWSRINDNHKSVRGIPEIPEPIQKLFATAHDVSVDFHVQIQAAFQRHVDNGVSKCVSGDTILFTSEGLRRIEEFHQGDAPDSFRPLKLKLADWKGPVETDLFYFNGEQDTIIADTDLGTTLEATPNHQVRVLSGGEIAWKRMDALHEGDVLLVPYGTEVWGNLHDFKEIYGSYYSPAGRTNANAFTWPHKITTDLARLIGYLVSDGGYSANQVIFTQKDPAVMRDFVEICEKRLGKRPRVYADKRREGLRVAVLNGRDLIRFFADFVGTGNGAANKRTPPCILSSGREIVKEYLKGLTLDGHVSAKGRIVAMETVSLRLAREVQMLLLNLGIPSRLESKKIGYEYRKPENRKERIYSAVVLPAFRETFLEQVGFAEERKNQTARLHTCNDGYDTYYVIPGIRSWALELAREKMGTAKSKRTTDYLHSFMAAKSHLTRETALHILDITPELKDREPWKKLNGIAQEPAVFVPIKRIRKSRSKVYDFQVPATHSFITNGFVSHNTINLPNSATIEDVRNALLLAYELRCKGITIYRDGSKAQQVLNLAPAPTKTKRRDPATAFGVSSEYYQIKTGYGPLHIHINYDERGPYQVFTNIPPLGTEISGLTSLIGILLSKYLAEGGDPIKILKHLNAVKGDRPIGLGDNKVNSIPHAISIALRQHLKKTGWINEGESDADKAKLEVIALPKAEYCPKCYSSNVSYESGCSGPTCHDCGFSECS